MILEEETIVREGFKITIETEEYDLENPRDWDNTGTMACFHGRYNLGDQHDFEDTQALDEFLKREDVISLPLYLYDHSGITISTEPFSCPWDSGQVGYIYVTKEKMREVFMVERVNAEIIKQAMENLRSEVRAYDSYLRGDCYRYTIHKLDEDGEEDEEVESCGGYLGDLDYCRKEAGSMLDYYLKQQA